jgi:uncharacterized NAD(P)/FAD-binding protein YdhS
MVQISKLSKNEIKETGFNNRTIAAKFMKEVLNKRAKDFKKKEDLIKTLKQEYNKMKKFGIDLNETSKTDRKIKIIEKTSTKAKEKLDFLRKSSKRSEEGFEVYSNEGIISCNKILLATGNDFDNAWQGVIKSVWDFDYSVLKPTDKVIVIGTGLTMFDVAGAISDNCNQVTITAISKSGLMPAVQPVKASPPIPFEWNRVTRISLLEVVRQLRKNIELANGEWWRAIDGMRPVTIDLWNNFSVFEKNQFINQLQSKWNRARHRAPQQVFEKVNNLIQSNTLVIKQGRVVQASANFVKLADGTILNADYVFYAGGSIGNPFNSSQPFWQNLKEEDWLDSHPSGMGINATPKFQLIGKDGNAVSGAYTIGNNMRGTLLECTAIPELKVHAKKVAAELLGK